MKIVKITNKLKTKEGSQESETFYVIKRKGLFSHTVTWISDGLAMPVVGIPGMTSNTEEPEVDTEGMTVKAEEARDAMREDGESVE